MDTVGVLFGLVFIVLETNPVYLLTGLYMKTLTKSGMQQIRKAVESALKDIGVELGVSLQLGRGSFRTNEGHFRLNVLASGDGEKSVEAANWELHCTRYGLEVSDLGKTIEAHGMRFKITGIMPSRPKYPILAEKLSDGRKYKLRVVEVLTGLGKPVPSYLK